jgi:hypothetical protein
VKQLRTGPGRVERCEGELPEIVRAVPDESTRLLDRAIVDILRLMRNELVMDIVFVARYEGDEVTVSHADSTPDNASIEGLSHPRNQSFCQRVLDGRLPPIIPDVAALRETHELPEVPVVPGAYLAAPVLLRDGSLYGTLCCLSFEPVPAMNELHYQRLQMSARQIARLVDEAGGC